MAPPMTRAAPVLVPRRTRSRRCDTVPPSPPRWPAAGSTPTPRAPPKRHAMSHPRHAQFHSVSFRHRSAWKGPVCGPDQYRALPFVTLGGWRATHIFRSFVREPVITSDNPEPATAQRRRLGRIVEAPPARLGDLGSRAAQRRRCVSTSRWLGEEPVESVGTTGYFPRGSPVGAPGLCTP
jgi:hypothetical protein